MIGCCSATVRGVGERALKLLTARLVALAIVMPEKSLAKVRSITIELDRAYGDLRHMQYHPNAGWLKEHGYSETLAKCADIPDAEEFLSWQISQRGASPCGPVRMA